MRWVLGLTTWGGVDITFLCLCHLVTDQETSSLLTYSGPVHLHPSLQGYLYCAALGRCRAYSPEWCSLREGEPVLLTAVASKAQGQCSIVTAFGGNQRRQHRVTISGLWTQTLPLVSVQVPTISISWLWDTQICMILGEAQSLDTNLPLGSGPQITIRTPAVIGPWTLTWYLAAA